ncbi:hypothetical protein [Amycolatopsis nivea]|uniref:hypothetical protein n=1 Tax=Amycolatopsis nivea TaxID=1644109 RepID=UPI00106F53FB|nr:hypothetical protein [Amycolatopsis nivea]
MQGESDSLKVATRATFGALLDQWLPQAEIDATTRMNYEWMIRDHIRPVLGDVPLVLLLRDAFAPLEAFTPISGVAGSGATGSRSSSIGPMVRTNAAQCGTVGPGVGRSQIGRRPTTGNPPGAW